MTTKAMVLAAVRRRIGPRGYVEENRRAPTPERRAANAARRHAIAERVAAIDAEVEALAGSDRALREAARFVVDVDGDDPSIDRLRLALDPAERRHALTEERRDLRKEQDGLDSYSHRWEAGDAMTWARHVRFHADTLDELLAKIKPREGALENGAGR